MRHVEADDGERPVGAEDDVGGHRIAGDVGFGNWAHIAEMAIAAEGAAHHHHRFDQRRDARVERQSEGEVGHARDGDEGDLARMGADEVDDELRRRTRIGCRADGRHRDAAQPVVAMDHCRRHGRDAGRERSGSTAAHRCGDAEQFLEIERIARRGVDRRVAEAGRDTNEVDVGVARQQQQRHRVVDARIGIVDDLEAGHVRGSSP